MVKKKKVKILWDNEAKKSLRSIFEYIKNRESDKAAKRVRKEIIEQTKTLVNFPDKFAQEPYLIDEPGVYRYKIIWSYKIIYEVTSASINVLDIFHTSRDPSNLKK